MSTLKLSLGRRLKAGELVEVRSKEEILATLDANACLDGLPFMPEMFRYCGKRFQVYKRAHKTCDTVFPTRSRRMANGVHLETRCDGQAHGGCEAGCLIFWKEEWLKRVKGDANWSPSATAQQNPRSLPVINLKGYSEEAVWRGTQTAGQEGEGPTFVCQATRLPYATTDLKWWDIRQYMEDYLSRNVGMLTILKGLIHSILLRVYHLRTIGWYMSRFYDVVLPRIGGNPWPTRRGSLSEGEPTPAQSLNLRPGELVRVKPYKEILTTINFVRRNRGMTFDKEMVPYCGGEYRVNRRVSKIINEKSGKMMEMKTPSIILDSVVCKARYSNCRLFCPRSIFAFWREIWLERVPESQSVNGTLAENQGARLDGSTGSVVWSAASGTVRGQESSSGASVR